jgi:hypothetical protein
LTLRPGGGACRVAFGDVESDAVLHLAHSALTMLREFETGTIYELAAGMATLSFIGVRTGSVGVDYVRLAPVAS